MIMRRWNKLACSMIAVVLAVSLEAPSVSAYVPATSTDVLIPAYVFTPGIQYVSMTSEVVVRNNASENSPAIGHMKPGQVAMATGSTDNGWYQIVICGMTGYVKVSEVAVYTGGNPEAVSPKVIFPVEGGRIDILGDSVTYGYKLVSRNNVYANTLGKKLGAVINNYGLSGSTIAGIHPNRFLDRCLSMDATADVILVFGGTNDYGTNVTLGNYGDTSGETFYGGLNLLMCGLKQAYPDSQIVFLTPMRRLRDTKKNKVGSALSDYVSAIKQMGEFYDIPVVDLYSAPEVNFLSKRSVYMKDGLHPSDAAHGILADYIYRAIFSDS